MEVEPLEVFVISQSVDRSEATKPQTPEQGEEVLDEAKMKASLSRLGHNQYGEIVLTACDLSKQNLQQVSLLSRYTFLQRVKLDKNEISSLAPLSTLTNLVYLSARHNRLDNSVFEDIAHCSSTLERIHLDYNRLTSLGGMCKLSFLIDVTLTHNQIAVVEASDLENMNSLMRLTLADNHISKVELHAFAGAPNVRYLDLSRNQLTDIVFVSYLSDNLEVLLLTDNNITTLGNSFASCSSLTHLDVSQNKLSSLDSLRPLASVESLRVLSFKHNACIDELAADASDSNSRKVDEDGEMLSRSELVMNDHTVQPVEPSTSTIGGTTEPHYSEFSSSVTNNVTRKLLCAPEKFEIPTNTEKNSELHRKSPMERASLWVLYTIPQLTNLNGEEITSAQVGQAQYLFSS